MNPTQNAPQNARPALIAIDWGTSSLRAALLATDGQVLAETASAQGLLHIPPGGWPQAFDQHVGPWLQQHPSLTALMSGMVGSQQGWLEAPYAPCPATLAQLAAQLAWVRPGDVAIVPGMAVQQSGAQGLWDVMRGEETQVFGALQMLGLQTLGLPHAPQLTLVLPGTHSKWVQVQHGAITGLATQMTGECFALFRQHSILARMLPPLDEAAGGPDTTGASAQPEVDAAFDDGVARAQQPGGLLHHLFAVRTQALFKQRSSAALAGYLSGLVIGEELRAQAPSPGQAVVVVGGHALAPRYQRALARLGVQAQVLGAQATWQGLLAVAGAAGLLRS